MTFTIRRQVAVLAVAGFLLVAVAGANQTEAAAVELAHLSNQLRMVSDRFQL